jgi:hypothetical protein
MFESGRVTRENAVVYAYDAADELTTNGDTTQIYDAPGRQFPAGPELAHGRRARLSEYAAG